MSRFLKRLYRSIQATFKAVAAFAQDLRKSVVTFARRLGKTKTRLAVTAGVVIGVAFIAFTAIYNFLFPALPAAVQVFDVTWLKQGWTEDQRKKYYQTSQGSLIIPYSWYFALEVIPSTLFVSNEGPATHWRPWRLSWDNEEPMSSNENVSKYRLLPDPQTKFNPDRMPIGITKEVIHDRYVDQLGQGHKEWLSYTCAACHTAQLNYKGLGIRIDGAPALWNFTQFNTALANALMATLTISSKFDRFAKSVLARDRKPDNPDERAKLKAQLKAFMESPPLASGIEAIFKHTYPTKEGFGRMDALGRGANGQFLQLDPKNVVVADAPVSIPPLWYTHEFDWVQSVAALRQPMGRNVTESWGVNVAVDLTSKNPADLYASTHPMENLYWMETLISVLDPPEWPKDIFGPVDQEAAKRGKYLYEEKVFANALDPSEEELWPNPNRPRAGLCARCHAPVLEVKENQYGKRYWQLPMYKLSVIGTDPGDATNFAARTVLTGTGPLKQLLFGGRDEVGIGEALQKTTTEIMARHYKELKIPEDQQVVMNGFRPNEMRAPLAYPARPMAGYWTTPPFLHNGSVPNLYQLLSPQQERDKSFWTGNLDFDPATVGFETKGFRGGFQFKAREGFFGALGNSLWGIFTAGKFEFTRNVAGNSNAGHEFRDAQKGTPGVIGPYLTPHERRDIIEYMKVIRDVPPLSAEERERRNGLLSGMAKAYEGKTGD
jgi:hypothetical protein